MFHHTFGIFAAVISLILGQHNIVLSAAMMICEISSILMNIRWTMLKHGLSEHFLYLPINLAFAMSFFLSRVVFMFMIVVRNYHANTLLTQTTYFQTTNNILLLLIYFLQLYWFYAILKMLVKAIVGSEDYKR